MISRLFSGARQFSYIPRQVAGRFYSSHIKTFEEAKDALSKIKNEPSNDVKLRVYGLYKQATLGDCMDEKPGGVNFVAKAKWQAWNTLHAMPKHEAAQKYIELVDQLMSNEQESGVEKKEQQNDGTTLDTSSADDSELVVTINGDGILQMRLNRPRKKNAITPEMYRTWTDTLNQAARNPGVRLVSITGTGDYFSSGNDLSTFIKPLESGMPLGDLARSARDILHHFVTAFIDFPKPLIGLINGPAVGIAVSTLGLYDFVLADEKATFHTPFVSLGQTPEGCSSITFPRIMGPVRANNMLLFGHRLSAMEAHNCGLVSLVAKSTDFQLESEKLLNSIAKLPPETLRLSKELIRARDRNLLHEVNRMECDRLAERWTGPECTQAIANFFERTN